AGRPAALCAPAGRASAGRNTGVKGDGNPEPWSRGTGCQGDPLSGWAARTVNMRLPMKRLNALKFAGAAALVAGFAFAASAQSQLIAHADLKDKSGKAVGSADLTQTRDGVLIKLSVKDMKSGEHGVHIHAVGKCEAPFESAGPHFNPGNHKHGMLSGEA